MKIEHVGLPGKDSGVFVPKKRSFYISKVKVVENGDFTLQVKVSVCNSSGLPYKWRGHTVIFVFGVTAKDDEMELRKNLRILAEAAYGG